MLVLLVLAALGWASVYYDGIALGVESHDETDHEAGLGANDGQTARPHDSMASRAFQDPASAPGLSK